MLLEKNFIGNKILPIFNESKYFNNKHLFKRFSLENDFLNF